MDLDRFWDVIAKACRSDQSQIEEWDRQLQAELMKLQADEIVEWNHIFDRLAAQAYTADLIEACCLINTGAGADGFYYFRCWLIYMGRDVYEAAVSNPDRLTDVVDLGQDAEAETYAAAYQAWLMVTGRPDTDPYPARTEDAELLGENWNSDDKEEGRRRLPRLAARYVDWIGQ